MNYTEVEIIENQTPPVNLIPEDIQLFSNEFSYKNTKPNLYIYKNVYFNATGYIYNNYRIVFFKNAIFIKDQSPIINYLKAHFFSKGEFNETVICIHSIWSEGYFHWLTEPLQRLYYILKSGYNIQKISLLLPRKFMKYNYIIESLSLFGIEQKNIIPLEEYGIYFCKEILICPPLAITGRYNYELSRETSSFIKEKIIRNKFEPNKRIYISRRNSSKRKINNETDVINLLIQYKFEIIETENLSFAQQIELFYSSKWLISIHGAGLTNMMFMQESANVLEFREENDKWNNCYFSLASVSKLNYFYLKCKKDGIATDHVGNLSVDIQTLKQLLDVYL